MGDAAERPDAMYLDYYHLKVMPFEIGPDPRFLWLGSNHKEAFAILQYAIMETKGFVVITGDPGTGKSTLLNATIALFKKDAAVRNDGIHHASDHRGRRK